MPFSFLTSVQVALEYFCIGALAAIACVSAIYAISKFSFGKLTGWTKNNWLRRSVFIASAVVATISQSKMMNPTHDDDILLIGMEQEPITEVDVQHGSAVTNIVGIAFNLYVESGSAVPNPIWYRESSASNWVNFVTSTTGWDAEVPYLYISGDGTNVYRIVNNQFTNTVSHAQWHVGNDLPAVEIEYSDAIIVSSVTTTANGITLSWTIGDISYPNDAECIVEYSMDGGRIWSEAGRVPVTSAQTLTAHGFFVRMPTKWRIRLIVEVNQ